MYLYAVLPVLSRHTLWPCKLMQIVEKQYGFSSEPALTHGVAGWSPWRRPGFALLVASRFCNRRWWLEKRLLAVLAKHCLQSTNSMLKTWRPSFVLTVPQLRGQMFSLPNPKIFRPKMFSLKMQLRWIWTLLPLPRRRPPSSNYCHLAPFPRDFLTNAPFAVLRSLRMVRSESCQRQKPTLWSTSSRNIFFRPPTWTTCRSRNLSSFRKM